MAKNDLFSSRTAALERDEAGEQFYRPAAPTKPRASRSREVDPQWTDSRFAPRPSANASANESADRQEDTFLRARRRVPVRRGILPRTPAGRILFAAIVAASLGSLIGLAILIHTFLRDDPRFRINSASYIQSLGNSEVSRPELLSVFGSDIGRNVFFVPLGERRAQLEQLPWVKDATVMRLLPDQLRVSVVERVPVAFVRNGNTIGLVDADGVLLNMSPARMAVKHYSFPVVTGIRAADPLSVRAARMHLYEQFIAELSSGGKEIPGQLSEVDISDPEDIRSVMPAQGSDILVHFGDSSFLQRYRRYQEHLAEWRKLYPNLTSVDMRYENQAVLEMSKGQAVTSGDNETSPLVPAQVLERKPNPERPMASRAAVAAPSRPRAAHPGSFQRSFQRSFRQIETARRRKVVAKAAGRGKHAVEHKHKYDAGRNLRHAQVGAYRREDGREFAGSAG